MLSLILSTLAIVAPLNVAKVSECTTMGHVTVCAGGKVEVRDVSGALRTYGTEIIPAARGGKLEL